MTAQPLQKKIQNQAYQIVSKQLFGVAILSLIALFFSGVKSGISVLAGGMVYLLPSFLFVWRVFRYSRPQEMQQFMIAFFLGEMAKLIFSAILFLLVVKYLPVSLLSILVGFIGAIVSFWIVCMMQFARQKGVASE